VEDMLVWHSFLLAFSALLPLINPLGSAMVFLGLAGDAPRPVYKSLARKIAFNNVIFLGIFELLGSTILKFFGISLPIVQVSGGLVIAAIGWSVLNEKDSGVAAKDKQEEAHLTPENQLQNLEEKAFYPFTFPVTSGPGTLVVLLTLSARFSGGPDSAVVLAHLALFLAIVAVSLLVFVCYAHAAKLTKLIPASTAHGILRVVAFILLCIGVQITWNGASTLIATLSRH
jgi:multiple antibiotic resistance protein